MPSKNTRPEVLVQLGLTARGIRFRTHDKSLPGTPDVVLEDYPIAVLVHGCYWHRHYECQRGMRWSSNSPLSHLVRNSAAARDVRVIKALRSLELKVFVAWECHLEASVDIALSRLEELIEVSKVHE